MTKCVHVKLFYSPNCPFSFEEIAKVREVVASFGGRVSLEEINVYERPRDAERVGMYGLLSGSIVSIFIDGWKYKRTTAPLLPEVDEEELSNAIKEALEKGEHGKELLKKPI